MFKSELDENNPITIGTVVKDKLPERPGHHESSQPSVPAHKV